MTTAGKRIGRPIKPALLGERPSLGLKVTAATKALIETLARASGRTQSAEAEFLIERCIQYDRTLAAMRITERQLSAAQARLVTLKHDKRTLGDNDAPIDDSVGCQPSQVTS
jgi:hypothetical protein